MAVRVGSYPWAIERPDKGMNIASPGRSQQGGEHRIIRNWRVSREDWHLRGGATAIPTSGVIGATTTAGAKGLYIWYAGDGARHIYAAFPKAASTKVDLYEITTAAATNRGGAFDTTNNIAMAGLRDGMYASDGRSRLQKVTGGTAAEAASIDGPGIHGASRWAWLEDPKQRRPPVPREYLIGTPPHAGNFPEDSGILSSYLFPLWVKGNRGTAAWSASGMSATIRTNAGAPAAGMESLFSMRIEGTASIATGAKVYYTFGTGGTSSLGGVHFWVKSTRPSQFLKLEFMDSLGSARVRDLGVEINQTGRWEHKQYMLDGLPHIDRQNIASARFVVTDASATFVCDFSNLYFDGLQIGEYDYVSSFVDTDSNLESPLGDVYTIRCERGPYRAAAVSLPAVRTIDARADTVRWYRRGGASPEWRLATEVNVDVHAWDFGGDMDMGSLSPDVPFPPPRAKSLSPFGHSRMLYANGLDVGDAKMAIPTAFVIDAIMNVTNMNRVLVGGYSRGVEFYAAGTASTGSFAIKLTDGGVTKRKVTVDHSDITDNAWNEALWTSAYRVASGSGVYGLTYSGIAAMTNVRLGAFTSGGKPSYAHLLEYRDRVWVSRQDAPTYCDRYTPVDARGSYGFWIDLPGAGAGHAIVGVGRHGSDPLLFTRSTTSLLTGNTAQDMSILEVHSTIGAVSGEAITEYSDWTLWPGGAAGDVQVYAFGPEIKAATWLPVPHEGQGISIIGAPVKPILDAVSDPTKMSAGVKDGRWYLFLGEDVTYDGQVYNVLVFDFATFSWVSDRHSTVRMKHPRFAVTAGDTDQLIVASPVSTGAGNSTNRLWQYDSPDTWKDGTSPIAHLYESRRMGVDGARITRLRSVDLGMESATAGAIAVEPVVDAGTVGRLTTTATAVRDGQITLPRFGVKAQGRNIGVRVSGTAATAMTLYDLTLYLDAKR